MSRELKNKIIVITGGAEGIGFGIADNFLKDGAKLIILLDINKLQGIEAVKKLTEKYGTNKAIFFQCDVTKNLERVSEEILEKYKNVDVLVNNAGICDEFNWRKTIEINAVAVMEWSMKFWEHMRIDKGGNGGTIMNVASIYGYRAFPYVPFYSAAKHAVMGFTKSQGHEYNFSRFGVRMVAVCPGFTQTKLATNSMKLPDQKTFEDLTELIKSMVWQTVDVVGNAAVEIFHKADSGTAWLIEDSRPIEQIS